MLFNTHMGAIACVTTIITNMSIGKLEQCGDDGNVNTLPFCRQNVVN